MVYDGLVYKVTYRGQSAFMFNTLVNVKYQLGEIASPQFGKIFAFKTRDLAVKWAKYDYYPRDHSLANPESFVEIWEALGTGVLEAANEPRFMADWRDIESRGERWWKDYLGIKRDVFPNAYFGHLPDGTVLCSTLTPTKLLYYGGKEVAANVVQNNSVPKQE